MTNKQQDASPSQTARDRARAIRNRHLLHMAVSGDMDNFGDNWPEEAAIRAMIEFASLSATPAPGATAQDGVEEAARAAAERCSFCDQPATTSVADDNDTFDCCDNCEAAWQRDPGFMKDQRATPTIPAGMVAWGPNSPGYPAPPSDWDNKAVAWGDGTVDRGLIGDKAWERGKNPGGYIIAYTPLAAAPKQAEQQGVERAAIYKAVRDAWFDGRGSRGGQYDSEGVEATWGRLIDRALAALNAPTGAVEKGEAK